MSLSTRPRFSAPPESGLLVDDGIGDPDEGSGTSGKQRQSRAAFGAQNCPEVDPADGKEEEQVDRAIGKPTPDSHGKPIHSYVYEVLARRFVESHHTVPDAGVAPRNRRGMDG